MRRIPILISLVLVLAFALASCADAGEGTQVPGVTDEFDLTAMPPTGEPEGFPDVTEPVATEPVETPALEVTEPVLTETAVPAETEVLPPTGMLDANRLSVLMDFDVVSQDGEQVGEVDDFILNLTNTKIDYVIVDSATFLDIGGRKIAVPWKSVEITVDDDGEIAEDENVFMLAFDRPTFENAPDFDLDAFPTIGEEVTDWDLYLADYWKTVGTGTGADDVPGNTGKPAAGRVKGTALASDLLGMNLVDENGETFGEIQDAIVNLKNGKVKYLVVQFDTADGVESRLLAVPVLALRWDADGQLFGFTVDRPTLDAAPFFEDGEWPDTNISGWDDQLLAYWRDFVDGLDGE